jgi:hypothetical protein
MPSAYFASTEVTKRNLEVPHRTLTNHARKRGFSVHVQSPCGLVTQRDIE